MDSVHWIANLKIDQSLADATGINRQECIKFDYNSVNS